METLFLKFIISFFYICFYVFYCKYKECFALSSYSMQFLCIRLFCFPYTANRSTKHTTSIGISPFEY